MQAFACCARNCHGMMFKREVLKNRAFTFTVPKNRKPKFDLTLKIIDLNNIPLVVGTSYVKWHLPSSTAAEHRGRTEKAPITDHKAIWEYTKELAVKMTIDKNQHLQECDIHFEVLQEYSEGAKHGRVVLGNVRLNLAEYVDRLEMEERDRDNERDGEDGGVTRRYLMRESKINSTLKVGIHLRQTEGDTNFIAPPLKTAMVFGGIAGIVSAEAVEGDDIGHITSITSKTRELSELQDIYRRTLAATWACQAGELPPDKLVEDLFAGGDGGRMAPPAPSNTRYHRTQNQMHRRDESAGSSSDTESRKDSVRTVTPQNQSVASGRDGHVFGHGRGSRNVSIDEGASPPHHGSISGRGSIDQQVQQSQKEFSRKRTQGSYKEVSEFDIRDDLRSWEVAAR